MTEAERDQILADMNAVAKIMKTRSYEIPTLVMPAEDLWEQFCKPKGWTREEFDAWYDSLEVTE